MRLSKKKVMLRMAKLEISQSELASRAEISRQTISAVMNGRECRPELVGRIARVLETEPELIIED